MPARDDLKSVLIIGAGPIVIGQACEFDYSGAQACKALKEEGYRVILVNSNPATIMTDPEVADRTYVEPITPEALEKIIAKELESEGGSMKLKELRAAAIKEARAHPSHAQRDAKALKADFDDAFGKYTGVKGKFVLNGKRVRLAPKE